MVLLFLLPPAVTGASSNLGDVMAKITDGAAAYNGAAGVAVTASANGYDGAINGLTITVKDSNGAVKSGATNALSGFSETTAATVVMLMVRRLSKLVLILVKIFN